MDRLNAVTNQVINKQQNVQEQAAQPAQTPAATMTLEELAKYDGKQSDKIYIACKQTVFDVTTSEFYGKNGGYAVFAGHDCSINLAKMNLSPQLLNTYKDTELNEDEKGHLEEWYVKFSGKYPIVAKLAI